VAEGGKWLRRTPTRVILRKLERWLAKNFPTPYPVQVHKIRSGIDGDFGECVLKRRRFILRVRVNKGKNAAIDTLIHEWMHAHTWRYDKVGRHMKSTHDDVFWIAFGKAYRLLWDDGRWDEVKGIE